MGISLNRITMLARYILLPAVLAADVAIAWVPLTEPLMLVAHFGLGYTTMIAMILGFRRRSAVGSAGLVAIALVLIWAIGPTADGLSTLAASLAGTVCGMLPAGLREWQRLSGDDVYMQLGELRRLWRRRASPPPYRPNGGRHGRLLALPGPDATDRGERSHAMADAKDVDR